ncbi:MAG: phosphatase PAP2 family protein [Saprospiraceae bacterium]|nr:phosphatase PAP2 family protein [Saprospiraceae bacterium]
MNYLRWSSVFLFLLQFSLVFGQNTFEFLADTTDYHKKWTPNTVSLTVPFALTLYGLSGVSNNHKIHQWNLDIRDQIQNQNVRKLTDIDDFLVYAPVAANFSLGFARVNGVHNWKDKTAMFVLALSMNAAAVYPMKRIFHKDRPDLSDNRSFPSGHTSNAFVGATLLWLEYRETSHWIGISGFAVAGMTGYLRMYNNRHWFSDVAGSAGIGILSAQLSWYLYPRAKKLFTKSNNHDIVFTPMLLDAHPGVFFMIRF